MSTTMKVSRNAASRSAARPSAPVRAVRTVRAQAMENTPNKEFRKAEAIPSISGLPTMATTPFDDWKFAPIREATVRDGSDADDPDLHHISTNSISNPCLFVCCVGQPCHDQALLPGHGLLRRV